MSVISNEVIEFSQIPENVKQCAIAPRLNTRPLNTNQSHVTFINQPIQSHERTLICYPNPNDTGYEIQFGNYIINNTNIISANFNFVAIESIAVENQEINCELADDGNIYSNKFFGQLQLRFPIIINMVPTLKLYMNAFSKVTIQIMHVNIHPYNVNPVPYVFRYFTNYTPLNICKEFDSNISVIAKKNRYHIRNREPIDAVRSHEILKLHKGELTAIPVHDILCFIHIDRDADIAKIFDDDCDDIPEFIVPGIDTIYPDDVCITVSHKTPFGCIGVLCYIHGNKYFKTKLGYDISMQDLSRFDELFLTANRNCMATIDYIDVPGCEIHELLDY